MRLGKAWLLVVPAVLGAFVFGALTLLQSDAEQGRRRNRELFVLLTQVNIAATEFRAQRGRWPANIGELAPPGCLPGPCAFNAVPTDPWKNELAVKADGGRFRTYSFGSDGILDKDDLYAEIDTP